MRIIEDENIRYLGSNDVGSDSDELHGKQASPLPYGREIQKAVRCINNAKQMLAAKCELPKDNIPVTNLFP
ncbi:MAG: hypothetical protein CMF55_03925 [Legionellales bacterium]|nr:hypothetical protein [Legionellales bacterium]